MNSIKAIIVDDEESARSVLTNLLKHYCTEIEILADYSNIEEAVNGIKKYKPDVIFLDIEMPNYAGYEIINFFDDIEFEIIFITAYDKYAIKAFEVSAIDYLLKPIDIDRLKDSVRKLDIKIKNKETINSFEILSKTLKTKEVNNIVIFEKGYQRIIDTKDIIAIEAQESYCLFHTNETKHIASKNLKHFENILKDESNFFRTHKSWIVNTSKIKSYSKSKFRIELHSGLIAKLSKYRKVEFENSLHHTNPLLK